MFSLVGTSMQFWSGLEVLRLVLPPGLGFEREGAVLTLCKEVAASDDPSLHKVVEAAASATEPGLELLAGLLRAVEDYPLAKLCFARERARVWI